MRRVVLIVLLASTTVFALSLLASAAPPQLCNGDCLFDQGGQTVASDVSAAASVVVSGKMPPPLVEVRGRGGLATDASSTDVYATVDTSRWRRVALGRLTIITIAPAALFIDDAGVERGVLDGAVELEWDGERLGSSEPIQIGLRERGAAAQAISTVPCPEPGKHTLRARYRADGLWSPWSPVLRIEVSLPPAPKVVAAGDCKGVLLPIRKGGVVEIDGEELHLRLSHPGQLYDYKYVAYVDGRPLACEADWDCDDCDRRNAQPGPDDAPCCSVHFNLGEHVPPGVYNVVLHAVEPSCGVASEGSEMITVRWSPSTKPGNESGYVGLVGRPRNWLATTSQSSEPAIHRAFKPNVAKPVKPSPSSQPPEFIPPPPAIGPELILPQGTSVGSKAPVRLASTAKAAATREDVATFACDCSTLSDLEELLSAAKEVHAFALKHQKLVDTARDKAIADYEAKVVAVGASQVRLGVAPEKADEEMKALQGDAATSKAAAERELATVVNHRGAGASSTVIDTAAQNHEAAAQAFFAKERIREEFQKKYDAYQGAKTKASETKKLMEAARAESVETAASLKELNDSLKKIEKAVKAFSGCCRHCRPRRDCEGDTTAADASPTEEGQTEASVNAESEPDCPAPPTAFDHLASVDQLAEPRNGEHTRNQYSGEGDCYAYEYRFHSPAHFPRRGFGVRGEAYDNSGALIYEGMRFSTNGDGRYEVEYLVETPAVPTNLRLQLEIKADRRWHTITLPTRHLPSRSDDVDQPRVHRVKQTGYSSALAALAGDRLSGVEQLHQALQLKRSGAARFGFDAAQFRVDTY